MLRFAAYARVSTEEQSSSETQLARIAEHAVFLGGTVIENLTDVVSGLSDRRPGYNRILEMARRHEIDGVIVWKLDRFGRNHVEGIRAANELEGLGVRVYSVTEPTDDPFVRDLMLLLANRETRVLAERVRAMQRSNVQQGNWQWPPPPGYSIVHRAPDDKRNRRPQLQPNDMAPLIRRLFEIAAVGNKSVRELRDEAQALGITSTTGGMLSRTHVHKLLTNPTYVGDIAYGRKPHGKYTIDKSTRPESEWTVIRDTHPAIVDRETFAAVQAAFKSHQRFQAGIRGSSWLLTGLIRCAHCGSRMYGAKAGKGGHTYTCMRGAGYGDCELKSAGGKGVDDFVKSALRQLSITPNMRRSAEAIVAVSEAERQTSADAQRRNLLASRKAIEEERLNLARQLMGERGRLIAPDIYQRLEAEKVDALKIVDRTLATLAEVKPLDISAELDFLEGVAWDEFDDEAWREAAAMLVQRVTVRRLGERLFVKGKRGSHSQMSIDIMWTDEAGVILGAVLQTV